MKNEKKLDLKYIPKEERNHLEKIGIREDELNIINTIRKEEAKRKAENERLRKYWAEQEAIIRGSIDELNRANMNSEFILNKKHFLPIGMSLEEAPEELKKAINKQWEIWYENLESKIWNKDEE